MASVQRLHRCGGAWRHPDKVPAADPPTTLMEKIRLSGNLIPCGALIVFICWVLIAGYATATECAAYGVVGALGLGRLEPQPDLGQLQRRLDGHRTIELHDHVHLGRCGLFHQNHGLHRHSTRAGRMGQRHATLALGLDRGAHRGVFDFGHGPGRHQHDCADQRRGAAHDPKSGFRFDLVWHLHCAVGRNRRGHTAGGLSICLCCKT